MLDPNDVISQKPDEKVRSSLSKFSKSSDTRRKAVITYLAMILPVLTPADKIPSNSTLVSHPAQIEPFEAGKQEPSFTIRSCHVRPNLTLTPNPFPTPVD